MQKHLKNKGRREMNKQFKIFLFLFSVGLLYSTASSAFPFPSPLPGKDAFNLAMDKVENLTAKTGEAQQKLASLKKSKEKAKAGDFGLGDLKAYSNSLKTMDFKSLMPDLKVPEMFAKNINDQDKLAEDAKKNLIPVYDESGGHSVIAKEQNIKRTEISQDLASTLFAHAHVSRYNLAQSTKTETPEIDTENTRQILQAQLATNEVMMKRWNDIVYMMAKTQEYESSRALMTMSLTANNAEKITNSEGGV